jgi:hypothetical protein
VRVKRVVEVTVYLFEIYATKTGDSRFRIGLSGAGKDRDESKGFFKFRNEDILVDPVFTPPSLLAMNVLLGGCREADSPRVQRERSSRRISAAFTRRFSATSMSESRRA